MYVYCNITITIKWYWNQIHKINTIIVSATGTCQSHSPVSMRRDIVMGTLLLMIQHYQKEYRKHTWKPAKRTNNIFHLQNRTLRITHTHGSTSLTWHQAASVRHQISRIFSFWTSWYTLSCFQPTATPIWHTESYMHDKLQ